MAAKRLWRGCAEEASGADCGVNRACILAGFRTTIKLAAAALILSHTLVLAVRDLGLEADAARSAAAGRFKPFENIGGAGEGTGEVPEVEEDEFGGAKVRELRARVLTKEKVAGLGSFQMEG